MTTDSRGPRDPHHGATSVELRLYVVAFLAAVHAITWRAIGGQADDPVETTTPTVELPRFVWIDRLPSDLRPPITLPPGWRLAPSVEDPTRVVEVPIRVPRVRTRSS